MALLHNTYGRWFNFIIRGIIYEYGKYDFSILNSDRTLNSLKAGSGMTISLPIDGPQTTLSFSVAAILPIDTLTGVGAAL